MTLRNPAHAADVLRHLEELRNGRIVEASELPSEEALEVVHAQLCLLVYRPEPRQLSEEELDQLFSKP